MLLTIFFIILIIDAIILSFLTEVEHFGWATTTLIATLVGLHFIPSLNVYPWILSHGVETFYGVLIYFGVAIGWSFLKWFSFLHQWLDQYRVVRAQWFADQGLAAGCTLTVQQEDAFSIQIKSYNYSYRSEFKGNLLGNKPKAKANKARIIAWMAFWPFSMVGTLINDPIRRIFKLLFNIFSGLYQKMADKVFSSHPELK